MNLSRKKALAISTLKIGKSRIRFNTERMDEIKEAITKEDVRSLLKEGAITIKEVNGRKKIVRRKTRRGPGKIKKKVDTRKKEYVAITRKLRKYILELKNKNLITSELYKDLRKKIRMRTFRSKNILKDHLEQMKKLGEEGIIEKDTKSKGKARK